MRDERLEYGIRVAAGEMEKTLSDSIPVKLLINGSIDDSNESIISLEMWGKDHVHSLFTILADVKETFTEHFDKFLLHYGQEIQSTEVIIITCYIDDAMIGFARKKRQEGIWVRIYIMSYEADSRHYEDVEVYYLLDYLQEAGEGA